MNIISQKDIDEHRVMPKDRGIKHISEVFIDLVDKWKQDPSYLTGKRTTCWPVFNSAFGGARPGELITLTSETGTGKTTFAMNWLMDTVRQGITSMVISLELPMFAIGQMIAQMITGKSFSEFDASVLGGVGEVLKGLPLYFLETNGKTKEDYIVKAMDYAGVKLGVKFILIDHMDYIEKNRTEKWVNDSYMIGDTMRRLCGKTREIEATTLLIAHPSKLEQKGVKMREVGIDELKGSSSIKQESDAVISVFRPDPGKNMTQVRFLKIRNGDFGRFVNGKLRMSFDPRSRLLTELSTSVEWDD